MSFAILQGNPPRLFIGYKKTLAIQDDPCYTFSVSWPNQCRDSSVVERQLPKLNMGVRFSLPAPHEKALKVLKSQYFQGFLFSVSPRLTCLKTAGFGSLGGGNGGVTKFLPSDGELQFVFCISTQIKQTHAKAVAAGPETRPPNRRPLSALTGMTMYHELQGVCLEFSNESYPLLMDEPYWVPKISELFGIPF